MSYGNGTVFTTEGKQLVSDLIGKPFIFKIDEQTFRSSGFQYAGKKEVINIAGTYFSLDHKIFVIKNYWLGGQSGQQMWIKAKDFCKTDLVYPYHNFLNADQILRVGSRVIWNYPLLVRETFICNTETHSFVLGGIYVEPK